MPITRLLIANRGEIAIALAGRQPIWVCAPSPFIRDDARSLHGCATDEVRETHIIPSPD